MFLAGVRGFALQKFSVTFCLVTVVGQIILGPVRYSTKRHCAAIFVLRNGRVSSLGR